VNVTQAIEALQKLESEGHGKLPILDEYAENDLANFAFSSYEDGKDVEHKCITFETLEMEEDEEPDEDPDE
jgi:hypothetical protein